MSLDIARFFNIFYECLLISLSKVIARFFFFVFPDEFIKCYCKIFFNIFYECFPISLSKLSQNFMHWSCLKSQVLDKEAFQKQMLEKLIWICSVMLVGARRGGVSVGVVEREFRSEVSFAIAIFLKVNLLLLSINIQHLLGCKTLITYTTIA